MSEIFFTSSKGTSENGLFPYDKISYMRMPKLQTSPSVDCLEGSRTVSGAVKRTGNFESYLESFFCS